MHEKWKWLRFHFPVPASMRSLLHACEFINPKMKRYEIAGWKLASVWDRSGRSTASQRDKGAGVSSVFTQIALPGLSGIHCLLLTPNKKKEKCAREPSSRSQWQLFRLRSLTARRNLSLKEDWCFMCVKKEWLGRRSYSPIVKESIFRLRKWTHIYKIWEKDWYFYLGRWWSSGMGLGLQKVEKAWNKRFKFDIVVLCLLPALSLWTMTAAYFIKFWHPKLGQTFITGGSANTYRRSYAHKHVEIIFLLCPAKQSTKVATNDSESNKAMKFFCEESTERW